jgi:nucleoside-diphosphate-sugar epimerase
MIEMSMSILVTGGTGFIGSHLMPELAKLGFKIYNLARNVTGRYVLGQNVKTVFADLRDYFAIKEIIRRLQPEVVIHLGALTPVSYSYEHPHEVINVNLQGTINLAESCLREIPRFRQFIFASTSETYGNQEKFPLHEDFPQKPNSPYAVSKLACEKYLLYMKDAYNFPVTIMRPFNTYGRKENKHFVVERIITQILENNNEIFLGNPKAVRDFLYVEDHVNAYLSVLDNEKAIGEIFNFCTGRGVSIEQLVDVITNQLGWNCEIHWYTIPQRPLDIKCLVGSYEKANKVLGWAPKWSLEDGISKVIQYWKEKLWEEKEVFVVSK